MPMIFVTNSRRLERIVPFIRLLSYLAAVIAAAMCAAPIASGTAKASGVDMQKPPDHEAAVRAEFERVRAEDTVEAYERFIRRHPDHPLVKDAAEALARLKKQ